MEQQLTNVWQTAWQSYHTTLTDKEKACIENVGSLEELMERLERISQQYRDQRRSNFPNLLARADPFITQIRSFSAIINTFIQSNPDISALVWGSLALVLELAARHNSTMEHILLTLEEMHRALPRFKIYAGAFPRTASTINMQNAIVEYYAEVIKQCQEFIMFLKTSSIKNFLLLGKASRELTRSSMSRLHRLRRLKEWVDDESHAVGLLAIKELSDLIKPSGLNSGTLPYTGVPYVRNTTFFGRKELLESLHTALHPVTKEPPSLRHVSLVGPAGYGKTQIALEYAHQYMSDYDVVVWCTAESRLKLAGAAKGHAKALGIVSEQSVVSDDQVVALLKRWLVSCSRGSREIKWLLVFDNVEDFDSIQPLWPIGSFGSVIVTTRDPLLAKMYTMDQLEVPLLTRDESDVFLSAFSNFSNSLISQQDSDARTEIAQRCGYLPLVLDLIRHHVLVTGVSFEQFLRTHAKFENLLLSDGQGPLWHSSSYPLSVIAALTLRFQKMCNGAQELMGTLALLDADQIPEEIFGVTAQQMLASGPPERDELPNFCDWVDDKLSDHALLDAAMSELIKGSLVKRQPLKSALQVHRITQSAIVYTMQVTDRLRTFHSTLLRLNALFPSTNISRSLYQVWTECERWAPHVVAIVRIFEEFKSELGYPVGLCELMRRCSWYFFEKHYFEEASQMADRALDICENAISSNAKTGYPSDWCIPRLTSDLYSQKGAIVCEINARGHGIEFFRRAIQIRRQVFEEFEESFDSLQIKDYENNIAIALIAEGRLQEALKSLTNIYETSKKAGPLSGADSHFGVNLASCYEQIGRLDDANILIKEAIVAVQNSYGGDSYQMSIAQQFHGRILLRLGEYTDAFDAYTCCFKIRERVLPDHEATAFACHQLGVVARKQGETEASRKFLNEAFRILGNDEELSVKAVRTAWMLLTVHAELGDMQQSNELRSRVQSALEHHGLKGNAERNEYCEEFFDNLVLFKWR